MDMDTEARSEEAPRKELAGAITTAWRDVEPGGDVDVEEMNLSNDPTRDFVCSASTRRRVTCCVIMRRRARRGPPPRPPGVSSSLLPPMARRRAVRAVTMVPRGCRARLARCRTTAASMSALEGTWACLERAAATSSACSAFMGYGGDEAGFWLCNCHEAV